METANTNYSQYPHGPPQAPSRVKYVTQGETTYVTSNLLYPQSVIDRLHSQLRESEAQREAGALEINRLHREREERIAALEDDYAELKADRDAAHENHVVAHHSWKLGEEENRALRQRITALEAEVDAILYTAARAEDVVSLLDKHGVPTHEGGELLELDRRVSFAMSRHDLTQRIATLEAERDKTCEWLESESGEYWNTACRATWCFEAGGVKENDVTFCHNCGRRVVAVPWVDEPEPDEEEGEVRL